MRAKQIVKLLAENFANGKMTHVLRRIHFHELVEIKCYGGINFARLKHNVLSTKKIQFLINCFNSLSKKRREKWPKLSRMKEIKIFQEYKFSQVFQIFKVINLLEDSQNSRKSRNFLLAKGSAPKLCDNIVLLGT